MTARACLNAYASRVVRFKTLAGVQTVRGVVVWVDVDGNESTAWLGDTYAVEQERSARGQANLKCGLYRKHLELYGERLEVVHAREQAQAKQANRSQASALRRWISGMDRTVRLMRDVQTYLGGATDTQGRTYAQRLREALINVYGDEETAAFGEVPNKER